MHTIIATIALAVVRAICAIPETPDEQVERRIAGLISRSGGRLTDDIERKIAQELLGCNQALTVEPAGAAA
jgi:hypothetical protein